jgi:hypothetical protein
MKHHGRTNYSQEHSTAKFFARIISLIEDVKRNTEQKPPGQDTTNPDSHSLTRYTYYLTIATWVIAGAAILTFGAGLLQYWALTSTDSATHIAAKAAQDSAKAAIVANETTRAQLAPYLIIPDDPASKIKVAKDGGVSGTIYVENTGQTPARDVYIEIQLKWARGNFTPTFELYGALRSGPLAEIPINKPIPIPLDTIKLSNTSLVFLEQQDSIIVFIGTVSYETIFKERAVKPLSMIAFCCKNEFDQEVSFIHPPIGLGTMGFSLPPPSKQNAK